GPGGPAVGGARAKRLYRFITVRARGAWLAASERAFLQERRRDQEDRGGAAGDAVATALCRRKNRRLQDQALARRQSGVATAAAWLQARYFMSSTERLRLISRVILRCMWAGMPVTRRGKILPLSVTNFLRRSGFL